MIRLQTAQAVLDLFLQKGWRIIENDPLIRQLMRPFCGNDDFIPQIVFFQGLADDRF